MVLLEEENCRCKYEQIMNMPKKWQKTAVFRIVTNTCKNEAGKPVFSRGFRGYRRNEVSPFRALTPISKQCPEQLFCKGRNEVSPFRALTQFHFFPPCHLAFE